MSDYPLLLPRNFNMFDYPNRTDSRILFQTCGPACAGNLADQHYRLLRVAASADEFILDLSYMETHQKYIRQAFHSLAQDHLDKFSPVQLIRNVSTRNHDEETVSRLHRLASSDHLLAIHMFVNLTDCFELKPNEPVTNHENVLNKYFYREKELNDYRLVGVKGLDQIQYQDEHGYLNHALLQRCHDIWRFRFAIPDRLTYDAPAFQGIVL